ncbi:MAG: hypothetical protein MUC65_02770 [Pontiellaceae bacterium]|nr:hypothetical protein [Pontiellaceae bacterium]
MKKFKMNPAGDVIECGAMKKLILAVGSGVLLSAGCVQVPPPEASEKFNFPLVKPEHECMRMLLSNAMGYLNPEHGLVDPSSGYPVEGWNHDPERGLYLRAFTQLTAIGERLELLANIAAGYADNPFISGGQALREMELMTANLLSDQTDPQVSDRGLLGNFLGLEEAGRAGPLSEEVEKRTFVEAFGAEQAEQIWGALVSKQWIVPQQDGSFAKIPRKGDYGDRFFTGGLAPFAESNTCAKIMAMLDRRVVQIIFGDNANLTASAAKAIGALRHSTLITDPVAMKLCDRLEQFIVRQEPGYRHLYDAEAGTFVFGWNATHNRFTGWEDGSGNWIVGHMDYLVNEFRGPLCFVVQRFGFPPEAVKKAGFKIKPYRMADGRDFYTLATWHGSAFQSLGLSLFMQEMDDPGWRGILENSVDINVDFSTRHKLPGFLSEAYSGNGTEYTGDIGIPDVAVTDHPRITDAPSLYTLGAAYSIAPDQVEAFVSNHWKTVSGLFTGHGPWEGFNTTRNEPIQFQTTAHTLALILGGIGSAEENMQRYLTWKSIYSMENVQGSESPAFDFLAEPVQWIPWSPVGDRLETSRRDHELRISGNAVRNGAITVKPPKQAGLSKGALLICYRAASPLNAVITLTGGPNVFSNEIFVRFDAAETEKEIWIPLPATPGLEDISELVIRFGDESEPPPVDLTLTGFDFVP